MTSLTDIYTWEIFKNEKSFESLDQFTANLLKEYSIQEDFTEIPLTTVDGVPLSSLPADCLKVVFDALSHLRESTEWNPAYISVFKFLCLLARRRDNRPHLLVYEYLEAIDNCSRDFLRQVLKAPSQCEEAARAFQLTSTFLEWVFDPEMTWRTWSEAITQNRFPPKSVVPSKGNAYSSTWLRDLLVATADSAPLNILQYALHLVCTECATSTVAAWSTISSALVNSLLTALATADDADNRRNLLITCATFLIERLSQTDTIHRTADLHEMVCNFCTALGEHKFLSATELLCCAVLLQASEPLRQVIISQISVLLPVLERTLNASIASSDLFSGLFGLLALLTVRSPIRLDLPITEVLSPHTPVSTPNCPNPLGSEAPATWELCLTDGGWGRKLIVEQDLYRRIYTLLANPILHLTSDYGGKSLDPQRVIKALVSWLDGTAILFWLCHRNFELPSLVDEARPLLHSPCIVDGAAAGLLIQFLTELLLAPKSLDRLHLNSADLLVHLDDLLKLLTGEGGRVRKNLTECCSSGLIHNTLVPCLLRAFKAASDTPPCVLPNDEKLNRTPPDDPILKLIDRLLTIVGRLGYHSMETSDVTAMLSLLRHDCVASKSRLILETLKDVVRPNLSPLVGQPNGQFSWIEFGAPTDSLLVLPTSKAKALESIQTAVDSVGVPAPSTTELRPSALGISFFMWLFLDAYACHRTSAQGSAVAPQRRCLFRLLTVAGNGVEAFISATGTLRVASIQAGDLTFENVCPRSRVPVGKWFALTVVFSNNKGLFSKPSLSVYINAERVFEKEAHYPLLKEDILIFHFGGCPTWVEELSQQCVVRKQPAQSTKPKSNIWNSLGFFSSSSSNPPQNVKKHLSVEAEALHLGPLVSFQGRITFAVVFNEALPEDYVNWVVQGGVNNCSLITDMFLQSNSLSLLFFYHAKAVDGAGQVCLDLVKSGVGRVASTAQTLPPASGDSVSNISPEDSTVANSCLTALEFPAHLIGSCQLTSTAFVDALYQLGGITYLLPIFKVVGGYPPSTSEKSAYLSELTARLVDKLYQFRVRTSKSEPTPKVSEVSSSGDLTSSALSPSRTSSAFSPDYASTVCTFTDESPSKPRNMYNLPLDECRTAASLYSTTELLELAAKLMDERTPSLASVFFVPVDMDEPSRISALFALLDDLVRTDTRVRQSVFHPTIVMAISYLVETADPLQIGLSAVLNLHRVVDSCAKTVIGEVDSRLESMGEFESPQLRDHERAIIMEDIRLRWIFFTNQFFTDWELWSKFPLPVVLLHIRQLVRRVKTNRQFYCQNLPISSLLMAAGFYFCPRTTAPDSTQLALLNLASAKGTADTCSEAVDAEAAVIEASNVILYNIRRSIYSMMRLMLRKSVTIRDVKALFSFAESSAHPDVISEVVVLIGKIFDRAGANDQFTLLTYEQGVADKLYTVILSPSSKVHVTAKINALKLLHKLIASDRVQEKYKANLLNQQIGGLGPLLSQTDCLKEISEAPEGFQILYQFVKRACRKDHSALLRFFTLLRMSELRNRIKIIALFHEELDSQKASIVKAVLGEPAFCEPFVDLLVQSPKKQNVRATDTSTSALYDIAEDDDDDDDSVAQSFNGTANGAHPPCKPQAPGLHLSSTAASLSYSYRSSNSSDPRFYVPTPPTMASKAASQSESSVHFSTTPPPVPPTARHSPPALDADELEAQELTLGELVVKAVHRILWPGESALNGDNAVNVVNESVMRYHQFLVSLTDSSSVYNLVRPSFWIVQRLFEELLSDLMKALRGQTAEGPYSPRVLAIVSPYVFLLVDETCNRSVPMNSEYRAELLESMSRVFFEVFLLWDADCVREDLIAVALHFLLSWTAHGRFDNNGAGAQACARLHHAICAFSLEANYERIAFLTFRLDAMIRASCRSAFDFDPQKLVAMGCVVGEPGKEQNSHSNDGGLPMEDYGPHLGSLSPSRGRPESYFFMAPLLKALLERYKDILELEKLAPNFPKQMSNFAVQFRTYVNEHSAEWETGFIERLRKAMDSYFGTYIIVPSTEQSLLRAQAHEALVVARRNRLHQIYRDTFLLSEVYTVLPSPSSGPRRIRTGSEGTGGVGAQTFVRQRSSNSLSVNPTVSVDFVAEPRSLPNGAEGHQQLRQAKKPESGWAVDVTQVAKTHDIALHIKRRHWLNLQFAFVRSCEISPWYTPFEKPVQWQICPRETGLRMRGKLQPNPWFSTHLNASRERDGFVRRISRNQPPPLELLEDLKDEDLSIPANLSRKSLGDLLKAPVLDCDTDDEIIRKRTFSLSQLEQLAERIGLPKPAELPSEYKQDAVGDEDWKVVEPASEQAEEATDTAYIMTEDSVRSDEESLTASMEDMFQEHHFADSPTSDSPKDRHSHPPSARANDSGGVTAAAATTASLSRDSPSSTYSPIVSRAASRSATPVQAARTTPTLKAPSPALAAPSPTLATTSPTLTAAPSPTLTASTPVPAPALATLPAIRYTIKGEILRVPCQLISIVRTIPGWFVVTRTAIHFMQNHTLPVVSDLALESGRVRYYDGKSDFSLVLSLAELREIHLCRYNLRRSAFEIVMVDHSNYLFNFKPRVRNQVYGNIMSLHLPQLGYRKGRSPAEVFQFSGLKERWANRDISNFEYLMRLNTIAGRTYNDLNQYPVFPWILADYTSKRLNLDDENTFRNLSLPVGLVNPGNIPIVREKYESFEDPSGMILKFHYGTHYSSGAGVMHYLMRCEPYTSLHIQLQGNRFDVADRQFNSIPNAWNFMLVSHNDNRELIPEFFFLPDFLRNDNHFDLGRLQMTGEVVNDVELPAWASTAEEFIRIHRGVLESDYVSANLHNWIDLIFGYKQRGKAAEEALNVYYYLTYEGAVDLDSISDPSERESFESMIKNFGQTPCQLLYEPHPRRISYADWLYKVLIQRRLPVLNSAILITRTNIAGRCSPFITSHREAPASSFEPRVWRYRTWSSMLPDRDAPSPLHQTAIDVVFSYHPPPSTTATTHTCMPVFAALISTQSTQIPNLRLPSSSLPLSACESPSGDSSEAGQNRVGTLKSLLNSGSASGSSSTPTSMVATAGTAAARADALSTHIIYSLLTVESCGFVRQHTVYPTVRPEQGVLTETELVHRLRTAASVQQTKQTTPPCPPCPKLTTAVRPAGVDFDSTPISLHSVRQRFLGPLISPLPHLPPNGSVETDRSTSGTLTEELLPNQSQMYALSTNGRHLYAVGRWDNRIAVYNTTSKRLEGLVTTPHVDAITCIAVDPGCYRKSPQTGGAAQYLITGSRDGTACIWNFAPFSGSRMWLVRTDRNIIREFADSCNLELRLAEQSTLSKDSSQQVNDSSQAHNPGVRFAVPGPDVRPVTSCVDAYYEEIQEELEACISPSMHFEDNLLAIGFASHVSDLGLSGFGRRQSSFQAQFPPPVPMEVARVIRMLPADGSGQPVDRVALYLSLDLAMTVTAASNVVRLFCIVHGVWSRNVYVGDTVPRSPSVSSVSTASTSDIGSDCSPQMPPPPSSSCPGEGVCTINHLCFHSPTVSFLVQWTRSSTATSNLLRVSRYDVNGNLLAESNVLPDSSMSEATAATPTDIRVTHMLTASLPPSVHATLVVQHVLLISTSAGQLILREAESLVHLRLFSIGVPISYMCTTPNHQSGGANLVLALRSGGIVLAFPGVSLSEPLQ